MSFAANPAAYIKKWLGHYTGAEATGLNAAPALVPWPRVAITEAPRASLLSASTDRRFPHLIIERGEYMRRASSRDADLDVSRARLGLGLGESPESEMMTMAPHRVGESIFSPRRAAVITDDDGKPVPDEEGGGSMPKGGQVHSFYYGDPLFEVLDKMTWKDCISWFMDPFRLAPSIFSRAHIGPQRLRASPDGVRHPRQADRGGQIQTRTPPAHVPGARVGAHAQMDHG